MSRVAIDYVILSINTLSIFVALERIVLTIFS